MAKQKPLPKRSVKSKKRPVKATPTDRIKHVLRFLPAAFLFLLAFSIHTPSAAGTQTTAKVLSYATSISQGDLLAQTNIQRANNGVGSLSLSSQLNNAAQTKANDMVTRDYWAHVTPEGKQPWDFISETAYQYTTAGENLAYGFATSADNVTGWMNSPPHKENLLNENFTEVGFGFANSNNYVGSGQQTIVVAMYAHPQNSQPAAAPVSAPPATPATQGSESPAAQPEPVTAPVSEPIQTVPAATGETSKPTEQTKLKAETVAATASPLAAKPTTVSRIQLLTGGNASWSRVLLVGSIVSVTLLWMLQRGFHLSRRLLAGEQFMLHHLHIDFTVFGFLALGWTLLQATGSVR